MKFLRFKTQDLIILIVTKNNPFKLKNLLDSINNNPSLTKSEICIIDDSNKRKDIIENQKIANYERNNKILLINRDNWKSIKRILFKETKITEYKFLLKELILGVNYWNTH